MTAMVYTGVNIFPTFGTKKSKMECKNITSIFIKVIQRKKNTPPLTGKVSTLKEKKQQVFVFLCIYKNLLLYLRMIFPRVLFQTFLVKGIPLI